MLFEAFWPLGLAWVCGESFTRSRIVLTFSSTEFSFFVIIMKPFLLQFKLSKKNIVVILEQNACNAHFNIVNM